MEIEFKKDSLAQRLREAILSGAYTHGEKLPKEPELALEFGVSRDTLRAALKVLEQESLLIRLRSKGTFVNHPGNNAGNVLLVLSKSAHSGDISSDSSHLLPGMLRAAQRYGLEIELSPLEYLNSLPVEDAAAGLRQRRNLRGCVIFEGCYSGEEHHIRILQHSGLPVVMAACHEHDVRNIGFAGVRVDQRAAWIAGVRALKEAGHRRIATITNPIMQGFHDDIDSYREFLRAEEIYDETLLRFASYDAAEIEQALRSLMELPTPPSAVICYSDFYAIVLMEAASRLGIRIPRDLSVMGYCGFSGGKLLAPPLSTVDFHFDTLGEKVVELIARADEWHTPEVAPPEIIMPHEVVLRKSAAVRKVEERFTPKGIWK